MKDVDPVRCCLIVSDLSFAIVLIDGSFQGAIDTKLLIPIFSLCYLALDNNTSHTYNAYVFFEHSFCV